MVPKFRNVGERYTTKNHGPFGLRSEVCNFFKKFVNNRLVNQLA